MSFIKHSKFANFGVYTLWYGREDLLQTLVDDAETMEKAQELAELYVSAHNRVVVVDKQGNIVAQYEEVVDPC
jgi:hypothetical protein